MILVTRMNNDDFYINSDIIELIEETPDTVITTTTGRKYLVKDSAKEVIQKIVKFKQIVLQGSDYSA